jgi:hypothetical protein
MPITSINSKLDSIRGTIISSTTRIEFILGYSLRTYFFPKTNNKATILFWNVFNSPFLTFDDKISIYESIPYFQRLKKYQKIKESLRFVQKLRNTVAHWELDEKKSTIQDIVMFTLVGKYRTETINDTIIENFKNHINFLLKEFGYVR